MNKDRDSAANTGFLQEIFLAPEDVSRCFGSLSKLARHLDGPVVITGSIAAGWHLLNGGRRLKKRRLNDIDTVAERHGAALAALGFVGSVELNFP